MSDNYVLAILGFHEPLSCLTHLFAIPVFVILGCVLAGRGRGSWTRVCSLVSFVAATIFLLSMSSTYHLLAPGAARSVMRQLDIAGVFVLIASTATPIHAILFKGVKRWLPLVLVWGLAVGGIILRTLYANRVGPQVGLGLFLIMGWAGLFAFLILWKRHGFAFAAPLLYGGVAYSLGAVVLSFEWPTLIPGVVRPHELWHVAVLMGLGLHWKFIFQFAGGPPPTRLQPPSPRSRATTGKLVSQLADQ